MSQVVIYGKEGCPYTQKAREAYPGHEYRDVLASTAYMDEMLTHSKGERKVPVIISDDGVQVGFNGG